MPMRGKSATCRQRDLFSSAGLWPAVPRTPKSAVRDREKEKGDTRASQRLAAHRHGRAIAKGAMAKIACGIRSLLSLAVSLAPKVWLTSLVSC